MSTRENRKRDRPDLTPRRAGGARNEDRAYADYLEARRQHKRRERPADTGAVERPENRGQQGSRRAKSSWLDMVDEFRAGWNEEAQRTSPRPVEYVLLGQTSAPEVFDAVFGLVGDLGWKPKRASRTEIVCRTPASFRSNDR